ncbi:DUF2267 domain-containing protein [Actinokineospora guangxiensis]|uniref:DUF2267 domain-containing protein n=1 Tax=Actinokineospora guangxiensis TaxID=1490288 RepID=A0ABW0EYI8_9PSEU
MTGTKVMIFEQAGQDARRWGREIAHGFPTDDERFVYRVLRAWLRTVRDELSVPAAAHLAAQLPDLLRGTYYEGWNPSRTPRGDHAREFAERFAREAHISAKDVPTAARVITCRLDRLMSRGQVPKALAHIPHDIRALLESALPASSGTHEA